MEDFFKEAIHYFFPKLNPKIDWKRGFEILDKELAQIYPESDETHRRVDMLVKVWLKNGQEQWILFHFEVQGYPDKHFGYRMFVYFYRLRDRFKVPIASFVILTDADKNWKPKFYRYNHHGTKCTHEFPYLKLAEKTEADFEGQTNPWAIILKHVLFCLQGNWTDEVLMKAKLEASDEFFALGFSNEKIQRALTFIKFFAQFANPEFFDNFDRQIHIIQQEKNPKMGLLELAREELLERTFEKGMEKGKEEGKEEGIAIGADLALGLVIEKMLNKGTNPKVIAELLDVSMEMVLSIAEKIKIQLN